jgi:transcriptional regulator with XRE-family HTH domain
MDNGNQNETAKPSVMNWRKLQARKAYLGLTNGDLAKAANVCEVTVSKFMNGDDGVRPDIQDAIARALGMRRLIDFEPINTDRDFAAAVAA